MNDFSLYWRLRQYGTLTESPADIPDAVFALPSTIHWMRAQTILVEHSGLDFQAARAFYEKVPKRSLDDRELNTVCEQLLFALHQIAGLRALSAVQNKADVARIGIVTWYYGIYGAASAMIAASDGSFQDNHSATARQWDAQFAARKQAMPPFDDRLSTVVRRDVDRELQAVRARGKHSLTVRPTTVEQAWGCHAEYLSGSASWERSNCEERVRRSPAFKDLKVDNFRTMTARRLRDEACRQRSVSYLHEASRYRGKANYRDAIFLAYGSSVSGRLDGFVEDLSHVLEAFAAMAAGYCSIRMGKQHWLAFLHDLDANRSLSIAPSSIWS